MFHRSVEILRGKIEGDREGRPYGKNSGFSCVRTGKTLDAVLQYICGQFSWFGENGVEKCKEKLKIMLDFLLG